MMKIVSIVGMPGAGKSEVASVFQANGYTRIRFGDITDREVRRRGLGLNEENERRVRELLRREHGMAAYAKLNQSRIDAAREKSNVVIDGLYSWEEYLFLKRVYGERFYVVAVWAPPEARYDRLGRRTSRPLTPEEAAGRDQAEIENTNKGGPIAMADFTLLNESSVADLRKQTARVLARLKGKG